MCASWKNEYNQKLLADGLEKQKQNKNDGSVQFNGIDFEDYATVLLTSINFREEIPDSEKRRIVIKAIFNAGKSGVLTPQSIMKEISKLESAYIKSSSKEYVLVTDISLKNLKTPSRLKVDDSVLIFTNHPPSIFNRKGVYEWAKYKFHSPLPVSYLPLRVKVKAKSESQAGTLALDTINYLRGIWNLFYNRKKYSRISSGKMEPINEIMLGPFHTLHRPNGKIYGTLHWYDPNYIEPIKCKDLQNSFNSLKKFEISVRRKVIHSPYQEFIKNGFVRYARALDERDYTITFMKLWSLLEYLTITQNENYKVTCRRAAFIYSNRDFHYQILNHLRENRNQAVHNDEMNDQMETLVYQLMRHVNDLLIFHISNSRHFKSLDDVEIFLDLTADPLLLTNRINLFRKGLKFMNS